MSRLLGITIDALSIEPHDFLGRLYMDLELGDARRGQFFTPDHLSALMAEMQCGDLINLLKDRRFITISEPACGSGGMILPVISIIRRNLLDQSEVLWVQATDIDRRAALMCYIQLSLWAVPAEIIVGDSLSLEIRETWMTPMHHLKGWSARLAKNEFSQISQAGLPSSGGWDMLSQDLPAHRFRR